MTTILPYQRRFLVLIAGLILLVARSANAFPPAPHHTIYGLVRDELGEPLANTNAQVIFETSAGIQIKTSIIPHLGAGVNYQLVVPMDSGLTSDAYKPTALRPFVPFRVRVQIGGVIYLPIEMTSTNLASLGKPAQKTHIDLTLGEDTNGDGIPDAWERALIASAGGNLTLSDIKANGDVDHDGVSNYQEYIAGTYAFDPADGFRIEMAGFNGPAPLLDFLGIRGRSYTLYGSTDSKTWTVLSFRVPAQDAGANVRDHYDALSTSKVRIEAALPAQNKSYLFKLQVQ